MKVELVNEITEYGGVWQSFEKIDVEIIRCFIVGPQNYCLKAYC
jgi:hypothetical protein